MELFGNGIGQVDLVLTASASNSLVHATRKYAPGILIINGQSSPVEVRLKGSSTFQGINRNPNLTVRFGSGQESSSTNKPKKLHLNNNFNDDSGLRYFLASRVFRTLGVPCPQVGLVRLTIGGRKAGIYSVVEGVDKQFLKKWFGDSKGNLYQWQKVDFQEVPEQNSGTDQTLNDLKKARQAIHDGTSKRFGDAFDVKAACRYLAAEILVGNWDGYLWNCNNYRAYCQPGGLFYFVAHGLDNSFPEERPWSLTMTVRGSVGRTLLTNAQYRPIFLQTIRESAKIAKENRQLLEKDIRSVANLVLQETSQYPEEKRRTVTNAVQILINSLRDRFEFVDAAFAAPPQPGAVVFDGLSAKWRERADTNGVALNESNRLKVVARSRLPVSARATVFLPPGKYQFEGALHAVSIKNYDDDRYGAMLRISGEPTRKHVFGTNITESVTFPFNIVGTQLKPHHLPNAEEIELVCGVEGAVGEAWFDLSTVKVRTR